MGRPEGSDTRGYDEIGFDQSGDFILWRPGQKAADRPPATAPARSEREGGFRWSEPQPEQFGSGERVRTTRAVGGLLGSAVPAGSIGHVVSTRVGLTTSHVTVHFDNGYTEELRPDDITHQGWF